MKVILLRQERHLDWRTQKGPAAAGSHWKLDRGSVGVHPGEAEAEAEPYANQKCHYFVSYLPVPGSKSLGQPELMYC